MSVFAFKGLAGSHGLDAQRHAVEHFVFERKVPLRIEHFPADIGVAVLARTEKGLPAVLVFPDDPAGRLGRALVEGGYTPFLSVGGSASGFESKFASAVGGRYVAVKRFTVAEVSLTACPVNSGCHVEPLPRLKDVHSAQEALALAYRDGLNVGALVNLLPADKRKDVWRWIKGEHLVDEAIRKSVHDGVRAGVASADSWRKRFLMLDGALLPGA